MNNIKYSWAGSVMSGTVGYSFVTGGSPSDVKVDSLKIFVIQHTGGLNDAYYISVQIF
jgi:hypothetical protein